MPGQQPASPHAASALELKAQIEAERDGLPFLIYRDGDARHNLHVLVEGKDRVTLGRRTSADLAFPWDEEVSRLHAELVRSGDDWTLSDDGLSLNGSFVNGEPIRGRRRLRDGDALRVGATVLVFRNPRDGESQRHRAVRRAPEGGQPDARTEARAGRAVQALQGIGRLRDAARRTSRSPVSSSSASTPSRSICDRSSRSSAWSTCRRTRSGRGWSSAPSPAASSQSASSSPPPPRWRNRAPEGCRERSHGHLGARPMRTEHRWPWESQLTEVHGWRHSRSSRQVSCRLPPRPTSSRTSSW